MSAVPEIRPTDPEQQREPWLATALRFGVYGLTAFVMTSMVAVGEGILGAALGAAAASIVGRLLAGTRIRTPVLVGLAALLALAGAILADRLIASSTLPALLGPSGALRLGDFVFFGAVSFGVGLATRVLSARRRSWAALEALLVALAFAQLVVAHRHGAINRPFELADPILERGMDPTWALLGLGGLAAVVLGLLLFSERSVARAALHLGAAFLLLLLTLLGTQLVGVPEPEIDQDVLGGGADGEGEGEGGGGGASDGPEFRDDYEDENRNTPVAVVLLHDEYSPPGGSYYFREDAFSQYNGRRMVSATISGVDDDVSTGYPAVNAIDVPNAPPTGAFRSTVETTVGLLADHPRPFGLESPIRFMPATNPGSTRFSRVYRVRSAVLTSDAWGLVSIGDRYLLSLSIDGLPGTLRTGASANLRVLGRFDDGTRGPPTGTVIWSSSDPSVAVVEGGVVRAVAPGTTELVATNGDTAASAPLTVVDGAVSRLEIVAPSRTLPVGLGATFTLTAYWDDGSTAEVARGAAWQSDAPEVAEAGPAGEVRGRGAGTTTVRARFGGVEASASVTVAAIAPSALTLTPAHSEVGTGEAVQFTATATFADGARLDVTAFATWSHEGLESAGPGALTAPREGLFHVTAELGGASASATLDAAQRLGLGVGDPSWSPDVVAHYTRGPDDPRYRELALRILEDLPERYRDDPYAHALAITDYLGANGIYSLRSRHASASDPTADFLFGDLTGYCVHFAHAAVYLMRSVGLPARVATGYMLPEEARRGGSAMLVTGQWSHAWPEIYVTGVGWVVVDVAPERALDGAPAVPDESLQQLLAELLRGETPLPFDGSDAPTPVNEWLRMLAGPLRMGLLFLVAFALLLGYAVKAWRQLAPLAVRDARKRPRLVYRATVDRLAAAGIVRKRGESPESFAARLSATMPELRPLTEAHLARVFGGTAKETDLAAQARAVRAGLSRTVPWWRRAMGAVNPYSWVMTR